MQNRILTVGIIASLLLMGCTQPPATPSSTSTTPSSQESKLQTELAQTKNELLFMKVKSAVNGKYSTYYGENTFQIATNKKKFIYIGNNSSEPELALRVWEYDLSKDADYATTGEITLDAANKIIYEEKFPVLKEVGMGKRLDVAGMDDNKLVLWETGADNSPGPCFSMWLDDNNKGSTELTAIDVTDTKPVRKPYVVPQTKIDEASKNQMDICK